MTTPQENLLSRHRILHELGRGTLGAVYAARERTTGAVVALKRLDPELLKSDPGLAERFVKRARSAARLKHRNIAAIHDAGEAAGTAYVAMELLEGESLRKVLDAGPLPVARAIRIAHDVASGLAYAHLEGVVHGAVGPTNIIVLPSGTAKITDFGAGQPQGDAPDHRSDIFALGAVFYEMLTGKQPLEGNPQAPSALNAHVPRALDPIVLSMLAPQPAARMPGVPILLRELERIEKELGLGPGTTAAVEERIPSAPPPPPPEAEHSALDRHIAIMERDAGREPPSPKSRPALYAAAALVLAVLGIGAADFWGITDLTGNFINSRIERGLAAARTQPAPAPLPPVVEAPKEKAPPPVAEEKVAEKKAEVAEPEMPPPPPAPVAAPLREEPKSVAVAPPPPPPPVSKPIAKAPVPVSKPIAKAPAPQREATARLILSVSPRGELYVDGEHHGTTPPVTSLEIEPGLHRIEVRSGSRKPFLTYVTMEPGDVRRIRHDFNARPLRPPG